MKATKACLFSLFSLALSNSLAVGARERLGQLDLDGDGDVDMVAANRTGDVNFQSGDKSC
jgi:hypothetical protein